MLAYETIPWTHEDLSTMFVINTLIGSAEAFSSGGPGKGMHCRAIKNLMWQYNFVESAGGFNSHFTDTGLFGINLQGPSSKARDLTYLAMTEMHRLREKIPDEEL